MRRFWIQSSPIDGNQVLIKGSLFHHVCRVCRFRVKDPFILVSKEKQYTVELTNISKDFAKAQILSTKEVSKIQQTSIHLMLSCPRFTVVENLLRGLVELGVSDLHLFVSDLSFIRKKNFLSPQKLKRWETIIQHSMAQSLNLRGMNIHPLEDLSTLLERYKKETSSKAFFFYEGECDKNIYDSCFELKDNTHTHLWLFIGSEGGFSSPEVSLFNSYGISPLSLGDQILRVETACLAIISLLKYSLRLF